MNNLKYTIVLDAKNGILPALKIVKKEFDNVSVSAKKSLSFVERMKDVQFTSLLSNIKSLKDGLSTLSSLPPHSCRMRRGKPYILP